MCDMSDEWRMDPLNENTEPVNDAAPVEPATTAPASAGAAPESGAAASAGTAETAGNAGSSGTQPPFNGWSSDGSYRYVPPRNGGNNGGYTSPAGNGGYTNPTGNSYTPPAGGSYTPPTGGYYTPPFSATTYGGGGSQPPQPPRKKHNGWIVAIALVAAVCLIGSAVLLALAAANKVDTGPDGTTVSDSDGSGSSTGAPSLNIQDWNDNDGGLSTKEVVNRNLDSTVVITVYSQSKSFNFGESSVTKAGAASGIVMTEDGYIITNWHCVTNESTGKSYDRVDVTTYDGKTYEDAKIIGADQSTDLAVIKINATGLSAAQFGDSSALSVGDRVVALGKAAGLSWTATQGIVSALARDVYDDTGYAIKCLQVDAAINYGNSGGPLLNSQGLVVGINSAKIAASGYEGLGFSIPINEAKKVIDSLMSDGYVKGRVALGITGKTVSSGMYQGFLIASITDGSSLQGTDAAVGDLIVAVDDTTVTDYSSLRSALSKHAVGDQVTLTLMRSDSRTGRVSSFTVPVTLKEETK